MDELVKKVARTATEEALWQPGDTVVVALSGGPDSTALLHMLHRISQDQQLTLVAAHANHGFRPEESAREADAVRKLCDKLRIRCEITELNVPAYMKESRSNAQLAARKLRYDYLEHVAACAGAKRIALGHHADDQAETVLMRLIRGTGPTGIAGIKMKRKQKNVELIRPLLRINKTDLIHYCHRHGLPYSTDSSNAKRDYFRNAVRLDVVPFLEKYNPQLSESLVRLAGLTEAEDDFMERQALASFEQLVSKVRQGMSMPREALLKQHVALQRRLIKLILNYLSPDVEIAAYDQVESVRQASSEASPTTWSADLGAGIRFVREYDTLKWLRCESNGEEAVRQGDFEYVLDLSGDDQSYVGEAGIRLLFDRIDIKRTDATRLPEDRDEAWFKLSALSLPLIVRNRRPGDRMEVLGLNGTKKVQDMFIDHKVPPSLRDKVPIVCDSRGRLLWIPGIRRSVHAVVDPDTTAVLRIRVQRINDDE
ncbi:tRNA lysidine(34) synthetase TilS [Paenibacillus tarimensis]